MPTMVSPRTTASATSAAAGAGRPRRRVTTRWAAFAFIAPTWLYVLVFYAYPLAGNLRMGFQDYTVKSFYTGLAPFVGWDSYRAVWQDAAFGKTVLNTVLFTAGSLTLQFAIGLALAVFFHRRFPLNGVLRALLLVPWLLPLVVSGTAWRWILETDSGVLNQTLGHSIPWLASTDMALLSVTLVNIWVGIPFNMVILYGGLQAIPAQLYEAAGLDGASAWQRFRRITLPLSWSRLRSRRRFTSELTPPRSPAACCASPSPQRTAG